MNPLSLSFYSIHVFIFFFFIFHLFARFRVLTCQAKQRQDEWTKQLQLYVEFDDEYTGINARERYLLEDPDWRFDKVPEIYEGTPCT
jgi:hypothetical protein